LGIESLTERLSPADAIAFAESEAIRGELLYLIDRDGGPKMNLAEFKAKYTYGDPKARSAPAT
jgi:hypothetical protein